MKLSTMIAASLMSVAAMPAMADASPPAHGAAPVFSFPYQQRIAQTCSNSFCETLFPAMGKETLVQHVSCNATVATSSQATLVLLESTADTVATTLPAFNYASTGGGSSSLGVNTDAVMFFARGEKAAISFNATGIISQLSCTISGFHT